MVQSVEDKSKTLPQAEFDQSKQLPGLATYYLLGRSGLRVSPLCFGTGTFGSTWGENWTIDKDTARSILKRFFEAGGNFVDTADGYNNGESEEYTGELIKQLADREKIVVATKFTFGRVPGDPNAGGNSRKNMITALDRSLKRLQMDYVDLYWVHNWDALTPAEEVMSTLNAVVDSGKVRYIGLSNPPAWYLGRAQTIAELRGWERICAIQMQYSLAVRNIEFEYVDAAIEMGIGICPWSPLSNGLLTGKYKPAAGKLTGDGRLTLSWVTDPTLDINGERAAKIVESLLAAAKELGRSPAQVALNWVTTQPGVVSSVIGATKLSQLEDNIGAMEFTIPSEIRARLDEVSKPELHYPYFFHTGNIHEAVTNQTAVKRQPPWYHKS